MDEVVNTGGELGGGEVVMDVAGKTGVELDGGEEVVPSGSDREIGGISSNPWSSSGGDAGTISVFEGDTWKALRASQHPSTSLEGLL